MVYSDHSIELDETRRVRIEPSIGILAGVHLLDFGRVLSHRLDYRVEPKIVAAGLFARVARDYRFVEPAVNAAVLEKGIVIEAVVRAYDAIEFDEIASDCADGAMIINARVATSHCMGQELPKKHCDQKQCHRDN